jgi:hypothetical protein
MPFLTPDTTDQHDALATFASHQLQQLAATLHGLSHEQLAATPTASAMSLGALARHCLGVARDIDAAIVAAPGSPAAQETDSAVVQAEGTIAPEALHADDTAEGLAAELNAMAERLAATIRVADLEAEIPVPEAPVVHGCRTLGRALAGVARGRRVRSPRRTCGHHPGEHRREDRLRAERPGRR